MSSAASFKAKRAQKEPHVLAPTTKEKTDALDSLFSKFAPQQAAFVAAPPTTVPEAPQTGGVEIFSAMGFGSIFIDGKDTPLPYVVRNPVLLAQLKANYVMDTPNAVLRTRKV